MGKSRQPSRNRITQAKRIMLSSLRESGFACSCGEPRYRGRPCVECRMCCYVADVEPYVMATSNLYQELSGV